MVKPTIDLSLVSDNRLKGVNLAVKRGNILFFSVVEPLCDGGLVL
jgi:hypothetical protein